MAKYDWLALPQEERVEKLKNLARQFGTDELHPTLWEVQKARKTFDEYIATYWAEVAAGESSGDNILNCALAEVWHEAKRFQKEHGDKTPRAWLLPGDNNK